MKKLTKHILNLLLSIAIISCSEEIEIQQENLIDDDFIMHELSIRNIELVSKEDNSLLMKGVFYNRTNHSIEERFYTIEYKNDRLIKITSDDQKTIKFNSEDSKIIKTTNNLENSDFSDLYLMIYYTNSSKNSSLINKRFFASCEHTAVSVRERRSVSEEKVQNMIDKYVAEHDDCKQSGGVDSACVLGDFGCISVGGIECEESDCDG